MSEETATEPAQRSPRGGLWSNGDFVRLWFGQSATMLGNVVAQLALPLVSLAALGATPSQLGLVSAAQLAPILVIGPVLGHFVDSVRRRPLLIGANIGRCLVLLTVVALVLTDSLEIWSLALCALALGTLASVFDIAFSAYFPTVLEKEKLLPANARMQASYAAAQVGGAGLGGWLVKAFSPASAFLFDIATFVLAAVALLRIRAVEPKPQPSDRDQSFFVRFSGGFRVMFADKVLRATLLEGTWFNFCEQAFMTVFLVFAVRDLGMSTDLVGYCIGLGSVGAFLGSFAASGVGRWVRPSTVLILGMGLASVGPLFVPLARGSGWGSLVLIVTSFCCYGFGLAIYNTYSISERQHRVEGAALGRAGAAFRTLAFGALPVGAALGGVVAELVGARSALVTFGVLLLLAWFPFSIAINRHMTTPHRAA